MRMAARPCACASGWRLDPQRCAAWQGKSFILFHDVARTLCADAAIIAAGTEHKVINTSSTEKLKLYTLYTPPEHPDRIVHASKAEADEYEKHHHEA